MGKYDDIIGLPYPVLKKHPRMSMRNRAAQFSPFAALTGYEDAVEETARVTDQEVVLDELEINVLNEKLKEIQSHLGENIEVTITYFIPDSTKEGGKYNKITDVISKINETDKIVEMKNGNLIRMQQIRTIDIN